MTRPPAGLVRNVRGGDRTHPQGGGCHKARDWHAVLPCGAYGVRQHATGRGAGRGVLAFVNARVLKRDMRFLVMLGVRERAARVRDSAAGIPSLRLLARHITGLSWQERALQRRMVVLRVNVEMLGMVWIGFWGQIGRGQLHEEMLRIVRMEVFIRRREKEMVVQRMGGSRGQTRQPAIRANPGEGRWIGRGCPRARRSPVASTCGGKRPRL